MDSTTPPTRFHLISTRPGEQLAFLFPSASLEEMRAAMARRGYAEDQYALADPDYSSGRFLITIESANG